MFGITHALSDWVELTPEKRSISWFCVTFSNLITFCQLFISCLLAFEIHIIPNHVKLINTKTTVSFQHLFPSWIFFDFLGGTFFNDLPRWTPGFQHSWSPWPVAELSSFSEMSVKPITVKSSWRSVSLREWEVGNQWAKLFESIRKIVSVPR